MHGFGLFESWQVHYLALKLANIAQAIEDVRCNPAPPINIAPLRCTPNTPTCDPMVSVPSCVLVATLSCSILVYSIISSFNSYFWGVFGVKYTSRRKRSPGSFGRFEHHLPQSFGLTVSFFSWGSVLCLRGIHRTRVDGLMLNLCRVSIDDEKGPSLYQALQSMS